MQHMQQLADKLDKFSGPSSPNFTQLQSPVSTFSDQSPLFIAGQPVHHKYNNNHEISPNDEDVQWIGDDPEKIGKNNKIPSLNLNQNVERRDHHQKDKSEDSNYSGIGHLNVTSHHRSHSTPYDYAASQPTTSRRHKDYHDKTSTNQSSNTKNRMKLYRSVSVSSIIDFSNMRKFLLSPLPKQSHFQCIIYRYRQGIKNRLFPFFECYYETPGYNLNSDKLSGPFLMSAKKLVKNKTSHYTISLEQLSKSHSNKSHLNSHSNDEQYLGKIRGNFSGSEYIIYDDGINPKHLQSQNHLNAFGRE